MNRDEPVHKRQFRVMHDCSRRQRDSLAAIFALPFLAAFLPLEVYAAAFGADKSLLLASGLEITLAVVLVPERLVEVYEFHIQRVCVYKINTFRWIIPILNS